MATTGDRSEVAYIEPVNLAEKFAKFDETWSPKIVGEVNDAALKVVKLEGAFVWHQHADADELFPTGPEVAPPGEGLAINPAIRYRRTILICLSGGAMANTCASAATRTL